MISQAPIRHYALTTLALVETQQYLLNLCISYYTILCQSNHHQDDCLLAFDFLADDSLDLPDFLDASFALAGFSGSSGV
jgi:hypothetical protein